MQAAARDTRSSPFASPRRDRGLRRTCAALLPVLVLGLGLGFNSGARADSDEAITGKARVVKPGVVEVKDQKFKLFGIHNPAGGQSCTRNAKPWNCAEAARTALRQRIDGRRVRCVPDESDDDFARCSLGDQDLSALLVREGWARADRDASGKEYVDEEKEARRARRGIWATDDDNPEEVRRQQQRTY